MDSLQEIFTPLHSLKLREGEELFEFGTELLQESNMLSIYFVILIKFW